MIMSYPLQISHFIQTQRFAETHTDVRWHHSMIQEGMTEGGCEGSSAGCSALRSCWEWHLQLLLQVAVDFKAVVARIGHHHVSVGGESQPLRAVQRVCRRVDVQQERTAAVKHLKYITFHYETADQKWCTATDTLTAAWMLTCILLFPQSATMMFPFTSTATPVGALNWPFPSPFEPNFSKNSPSVLNTCI